MRHLDRHEPLQLVVVGQVDEAEPAFAQDPLDAVAADSLGLLLEGNAINSGFRSVEHSSSRFVEAFYGTADIPF